jgi:histone H3
VLSAFASVFGHQPRSLTHNLITMVRQKSLPIHIDAHRVRKDKFHPLALRQIRDNRRATTRFMPLAPFCRLVRAVAHTVRSEICFHTSAIILLQEAAEHHLIAVLRDSNDCAAAAHRTAVGIKDIQLACRMRVPNVTDSA